MNKQELINAVADTLNIGNKRDADDAVTAVFIQIEAALERGEDVKISGFGTFRRVTAKARTCINPRTGETVEVPARNKAKFKASSKLKV